MVKELERLSSPDWFKSASLSFIYLFFWFFHFTVTESRMLLTQQQSLCCLNDVALYPSITSSFVLYRHNSLSVSIKLSWIQVDTVFWLFILAFGWHPFVSVPWRSMFNSHYLVIITMTSGMSRKVISFDKFS